MSELRRGNTLEYAQEKHSKLMSELKSDEHYDNTDTVTYGSHDPLSVPIPECDSCCSKGQLQKVHGERIKWKVTCLGCDKTIQTPQRRPWQAALMWCDINLGSQSYRTLPMFGLSEFSPSEAKLRMLGIRSPLCQDSCRL